jgi:hypothetical protein
VKVEQRKASGVLAQTPVLVLLSGTLAKQLAFAELALAVLAKTRTGEDSKPRRVKNGA